MKKKILLVAITYNSNHALKIYLKTIETALKKANNIDLTVIIGDNGDKKFDISNLEFDYNVSICHFNNLGYLGAAFEIINRQNLREFNYIVISNVDIKLGADFFQKLYEREESDSVGWVCPQIWSETEQRNRNPFLYSRNSKFKLNILRLFFFFPLIHKIYIKTFYKRKRYFQRLNLNGISNEIYAGHGSIFILTSSFVKKITEKLNYPVFLYGEECYFAELCYHCNLKVIFDPQLKVTTEDHISTRNLNKLYYKYNFEALTYILKKFY